MLLAPSLEEWGATLAELPAMLAISWMIAAWLIARVRPMSRTPLRAAIAALAVQLAVWPGTAFLQPASPVPANAGPELFSAERAMRHVEAISSSFCWSSSTLGTVTVIVCCERSPFASTASTIRT